MLPRDLLSYEVRGPFVVPRFLGASDQPWLRVLIDEFERFTGRREAELDDHLRSLTLPGIDPRSYRLAAAVLRKLVTTREHARVVPRKARAALFRTAAELDGPREVVLEQVATAFSATKDELERGLFADLPGHRIVEIVPGCVSPVELGLRANLALARGLLERASLVSVTLEGNARTIVRQAKLRRLICGVRPLADGGAVIEISGPFALFRHTLLYGRALGELVPLLVWCRRFRLDASCMLGERPVTLRLASGDPIFPAQEPRRFDSRLEERFFREITRRAPAWDVVREPEPVQAAPWLLFPDFALCHRADPSRRWLLEIVGFWTERYLEKKLAAYRAANIENLILCVADDLDCAESDLPLGAHVLRFHRSIDVAAVLAIIDPDAGT